MGSVVTGMAMGTGSAIAHRAVDGMMGPRQVEHVHTPAPAAAPAAAPTTGWFGSSAPAAPGRSYADLSSADAQMRLRAVLPAHSSLHQSNASPEANSRFWNLLCSYVCDPSHWVVRFCLSSWSNVRQRDPNVPGLYQEHWW